MDAATMQFAMEQMKKMDPAQLQAMMRSMPPDMMSQAMAQMKDMKPEDWERAKREMANMDSDTMARQAAAAQAQMAGRTQYVLSASNQLKQEGNHLHGQGKYSEAAEKYERAKSNVESYTSKEAKDLVRACTLNLSSCYLNLKHYDKCVQQCNQVLSGEPDNLKALYRRGQAHMGSGAWLDASADLERALRLARETDPAQAQPIRDKLQETKDQISALRASGKLPPAGAAQSAAAAAAPEAAVGASAGAAAGGSPAAAAPAPAKAAGVAGTAASGSGGSSSSGSGSGMAGIHNPEMMERAAEMLRSNPAMVKQAQEMMRGMSDEQLAAMGRQMGMEVSPEALRSSMSNVDPEFVSKMAELQGQLQAEMPPELRNPETARNPENMKKLAELMAKKPEMAATMGQVLSSIQPEQLQEMARAAGLPPGVTITPEMAKMAAESFKHMSPEEVKAAVEACAAMPPPPSVSTASTAAAAPSGGRESSGAAAGTSGRSDGAAVAGIPAMPPMAGSMAGVDPRFAADMLAAMTPEQLESMAKMMPGGDRLKMTPEMAKMAAEMMKNMSAEDVARMQEMAASMHGSGLGGLGGGTGGGGGDGASGSAASSSSAATAAGGDGSGGLAAFASEMMKNMTAEDLSKMQEMATKMGMDAGPGGAGGLGGGLGLGGGAGPGLGGADPMAAMMADPKMMESAIKMMRGLNPDALVSLMMSSGMCRDRAQAELMARQMSNISDVQLGMMMKAVTGMQRARLAWQRAREWVRRNVLLVAALLVVLLALFLRWLGYM